MEHYRLRKQLNHRPGKLKHVKMHDLNVKKSNKREMRRKWIARNVKVYDKTENDDNIIVLRRDVAIELFALKIE